MLEGDFVLVNYISPDVEYEVLARRVGRCKWESKGKWRHEGPAVEWAKRLGVGEIETTVEIHKLMHYTYMRIRDGKVNNQW
jgi:hypothetical protein